jgi:threonine-phosphate decarboxylase
MNKFEHGADIASFTNRYKLNKKDIVDFSSNINFVKPHVLMPKDFEFVHKYPDKDYLDLKQAICAKYNINIENIELFNGASSAIFSLFTNLGPQSVTLYAPIYLEYKKIAELLNIKMQILDSIELEPNGDVVVFVNPTTPFGKYYNLQNLVERCKNKIVIIDESFLDFCDRKSMFEHIQNAKNLYIIKSMTKYYGAAGVRVGFVASNASNILNLKSKEPLWKISSFDEYYICNALKDKNFDELSQKLNANSKNKLLKILQNANIFETIYEFDANFITAKLKDIDANLLQEKLATYNILIRNCQNFDFLDSNFVRFACKDDISLDILQKAFNSL